MKDSKIARQRRAATRLSILPFSEWIYDRFNKPQKPIPDNASVLYDNYLDRKVVEGKALGIVPDRATLKTALNLIG